MNVIRAHSAGFCMGVSLALQKLDQAVESIKQHSTKTQNKICTFGPIIHNPQVLEYYQSQNVVCIDDVQMANAGDIVIIRAHGIPQNEENILRSCGAHIVDATCPKVKKAQLAIAKATQDGTILLLFGETEHPEVRGLISYAHHEALVFENLQELDKIDIDNNKNYVLASQTTQDKHIFSEVQNILTHKKNMLPILNTICNATYERQHEAMDIASKVDAMVIVGGKQSGNTRRLADVSAAKGIPTWHVESVEELSVHALQKYQNIGLTAGASSPKYIIDAVHDFIKNI